MSCPSSTARFVFTPPKGYEIIEEIARGGMGVVYKARQELPARVVALKVMLRAGYASEADRKRFLKEANAAAALKHPSIVPVFEVGEHEGRYFFSMAYVEGLPLHQYLRQADLVLKEKLTLFLRICEAVAHAHVHGIIHRDLKPSNIMIDKEGNPHLLDFGLAKLAETGADRVHDQSTLSGVVTGTFEYMSPEQTLGQSHEVDKRSDVYSLGVILYEMLTGQMPYPVDVRDPLEILQNIRDRTPRRPSSIVRHLRGDLDTILHKVLVKEKGRRYQSVSDFIRDLIHCLHNEPIEARPPSTWYLVQKTVQRHKGAAALVAAIFVGVLIASALLSHFHRQAALANKQAQAMTRRHSRAQGEGAELRRAAQEAKQHAQQEQAQGLREAYFAQIQRAVNKIENRDFPEADQILDACPTPARHWEWGRLKRLCRRGLMTLRGHAGEVHCVAYSPDGRRVASGGMDNTVRIWDAQTGREMRALEGHSSGVYALAFSPDGKRLASGSWDNAIKIWDAETGQVLKTLAGLGDYVSSLSFSPDGKQLASASRDKTVRIWDAALGREVTVLKGHSDWVCAVAFSPDGKRIASGSQDKTIRIWDAATGQTLKTLAGHSDHVTSLAFSRDGRLLASASRDRTVKLWDPSSGREIRTLSDHRGSVNFVAFRPDGKRVASASQDNTIRIWDVETGRQSATYPNWAWAIAFSPDGLRLASANRDETVQIRQVELGHELTTLEGHADQTSCIAFSPDGRRIATGSMDSTVRIWDAPTAQALMALKGHQDLVLSVAFNPDGGRLASASQEGAVKIWDAATGRAVISMQGHLAAFSPDGRWIASADKDNALKIWAAATGQEAASLRGHLDRISAIAFSPDGKRLASAGADKTIRIWDAQGRRALMLLGGHTAAVTGVAFSPDGERLASSGRDNAIRIWDAGTGRDLKILKGHLDWVFSVCFSPDGQRLASASQDGTVRLWDVESGREMLTLKGPCGPFISVAFSPDGQRLAAAGPTDKTAVIWDTADWTER